MNRYGVIYMLSALFATFIVSCNKVPGHVIQPDDMASLIADIHIGESVIDLNRADYRTDSAKEVMLQSVLSRHNVTKQQLDTSFDWYGHNISFYMEVYDKTIEMLERRIAETGNRIAAENISIAGDSVDVWSNARFMTFNSLSPSLYMTFSLTEDENWERGDSYTWRAKFTNNVDKSLWGIIADYEDGSMEMLTADLSGDGWQELRFVSDSTKVATNIYGYLNAKPRGNTSMWADSIMLVRNRVNHETYKQRFKQQSLDPENRK